MSTGLGAKISGVDDCTFSSTGEAFSTISKHTPFQPSRTQALEYNSDKHACVRTVLPHSDSASSKKLQADDVSLGASTWSARTPGAPKHAFCTKLTLTLLFTAYEFSKKFPGVSSYLFA